MSGQPDRLSDARTWLDYAAADLRVAELARRTPESLPAWIACYHAQQAAEKALKGMLIARGREYPFSHDIRLLLGLCADSGVEWSEAVLESEILVSYAASSRYPSAARSLSSKEAEHAIMLAVRVVEAVQVSIQ